MAISDPPFTLPLADSNPDDLPRTLRREREAREREARERLAREMRDRPYSEAVKPGAFSTPNSHSLDQAPVVPAAVTRFEVSFFHLMAFFLKAVFAAVPALIVLGMMIWGAGHLLKTWYPDLVKMQILILFPPD